MTCLSTSELVALLEKDVTTYQAREIDQHLVVCDLCRERLDEIRSLTREIEAVSGEPAETDFVKQVVRRVRQALDATVDARARDAGRAGWPATASILPKSDCQ